MLDGFKRYFTSKKSIGLERRWPRVPITDVLPTVSGGKNVVWADGTTESIRITEIVVEPTADKAGPKEVLFRC